MSKELTAEEIRERFLDHVRSLVDYWAGDAVAPQSPRERIAGCAFSILVALDGGAIALPPFVVAPAPHPDDKQYHIDQNEDYYPDAPEVACDIAGSLHELLHM